MQYNRDFPINYLFNEITRSSMQSTVITRKHREVAVLAYILQMSKAIRNTSETKMKWNNK